jgi:hypothetical protein
VRCASVRRFVEDGWHDRALALGWAHDELFALKEPFANVSQQGAGWFIGDKTVVAVTTASITVRTASGATQNVYRKMSQRDEKLEAAVAFL